MRPFGSSQGVAYIPGSHITQGVQRLIGGRGMCPVPSAFGRNLQGALCISAQGPNHICAGGAPAKKETYGF